MVIRFDLKPRFVKTEKWKIPWQAFAFPAILHMKSEVKLIEFYSNVKI